ncbi:MAG: hypothetical protein IH855_10780 [Bacteroidetes bacterium]|nr:hypothetical protein [Bacteroidota bacterium]
MGERNEPYLCRTASEVFRDGLRLLEQTGRRRLLEKWLAEVLTPEEHAKVPGELLDEARSVIEAKIQEGLDALVRGEATDGEEFFARWIARGGSRCSTHLMRAS